MKRPTLAWMLSFASIASCGGPVHRIAAPRELDVAEEFVVMSFNLRYGTANDGLDAWPHRREHVLDVIREASPTILGVQEALDFQVQWLESELSGHTRVGLGREGGSQGEHAALLVESARFEVLESGDFWLSERPDQVASVGWDAALTRMCTWARLREITSGRELTVWNTHFDHEGTQARVRSAELIAQRVGASRGVHIVLGDLNCGESSAPLSRLLAADLRDGFRCLFPDASEVGTFHAFRGGLAGEKIDHILASPELELRAASILSSPSRNGRWPSDHHPVTVTFVLPRS